MCEDKYYSKIIKENVHVYEICPRCTRKIIACVFQLAMCPICVIHIEKHYPEVISKLKENYSNKLFC